MSTANLLILGGPQYPARNPNPAYRGTLRAHPRYFKDLPEGHEANALFLRYIDEGGTTIPGGSTATPVPIVKVSTTDAAGRLLTMAEGGATTSYSWDGLDNLNTVTQGAQVRTFTHDTRGQLTSAQNPENGTTSLYLRRKRQCPDANG